MQIHLDIHLHIHHLPRHYLLGKKASITMTINEFDDRLVLEMILTNRNATFRRWSYYTFWRNLFFLYTPLVPISRAYLNYHTNEQVYHLRTPFLN